MQKLPIANRMLYRLGQVLLGLMGWRLGDGLPDLDKFVIITTHTSNWDLPVGLVAFSLLSRGFWRYRLAWIGKDELFHGPLGRLLRAIGGIPIDRQHRHETVEKMVEAFHSRQRLSLVVTPEGTRKRAAYWKSGFYYIALGAGVPIVLGYLNYRERIAGAGPTLIPSGDIEADMEIIRAFYSTIPALHPEQVGEIRIRAPQHPEPAEAIPLPQAEPAGRPLQSGPLRR